MEDPLMKLVKDMRLALTDVCYQVDVINRTIDSLSFNSDNLLQEFIVLKERVSKLENPGEI